MGNYNTLKAYIDQYIKQNGNKEITGPVLNSVLNVMVIALGLGYRYRGSVTPSSEGGTPDANSIYIATEPGVYTNFGGIVVEEGEVAALLYDNEWHKETIDKSKRFLTQEQYDELVASGEIDNNVTYYIYEDEES